jgi:hypothetical protein
MEHSRDSEKLERGEVHVWFARLDRAPDPDATILNPEEMARVDAFFMEVHRNRFIAARALLRDVLAGYLDQPQEAIRFAYNKWSKPALAPGFLASDLRFNLSHSQDLAMYAFVLERNVGVDLEMIRSDVRTIGSRRIFLSRGEVETLRVLPPEHQADAILNCWTRKETYLKAAARDCRSSSTASAFHSYLERRQILRATIVSVGRWLLQARSRLCGRHSNAAKPTSNRRTAAGSEWANSLISLPEQLRDARTRSPELLSLTLSNVRCKN